jgi:ubiquinone/menaquinone biosynthesis C-methylase UbiE
MEADAETLFDYLGKRYEDAFAESPNLHRFISEAAKKLPAQSKVLDVGCGTGKRSRKYLNLLAMMSTALIFLKKWSKSQALR